jgi:hypothetical protein
VLEQLYRARDIEKQTIYEITGMADIVRGASNPMETATAQQIKGQFATLRLSDRQAEIQRFARDLIALKAEIISEKFEERTLMLMAGTDLLAQTDMSVPVTFGEAITVLRDDALRAYRIDIETDSTIAIDEQLEKQSSVEFLQSMGQFVGQTVPMMQTVPSLAPAFIESVMACARKFRAGRSVEESFEQGMQFLKQQAQQQMQAIANPQPQQPPPDPMMMKVQADIQKAQTDMQLKMEKFQSDMQMKTQEFQAEQARKAAELDDKYLENQAKLEMERERIKGELNLRAEEIRNTMKLKAFEMAQKYQNDTLEDLQVEGVSKLAPKVTDIQFYIDPVTGAKGARAITKRADN